MAYVNPMTWWGDTCRALQRGKDAPSVTRLTRDNVTVASRVMLPAYAVLFTLIGGTYVGMDDRTIRASAALSFVDFDKFPLQAWGGLMLVGSSCMLAALLVQQREWYRFGLTLAKLIMAALAVTLFAAWVFSDASLSACYWPAFVVVCAEATDRSLLAGERTVSRRQRLADGGDW